MATEETPAQEQPIEPSETSLFAGLAPLDISSLVTPDHDYEYELLAPRALRLRGRLGDPCLAALEVMLGADAPLGVWACATQVEREGMCLWADDVFYAIQLGLGGRWEQFDASAGLATLRDSWRSGARARYRVPRGALNRPLPEAIALAESLGLPTPVTSVVPSAEEVRRAAAGARSAAASASRAGTGTAARPRVTPTGGTRRTTPRATSRTTRPEPPAPKICQSCFMALPVTGICDSCS